jgi:hypothetical protein
MPRSGNLIDKSQLEDSLLLVSRKCRHLPPVPHFPLMQIMVPSQSFSVAQGSPRQWPGQEQVGLGDGEGFGDGEGEVVAASNVDAVQMLVGSGFVDEHHQGICP